MSTDGKNKYLFEVSWEVCNKVGGIYEVVASKALQAVERYGEFYYLIGPDLKHNTEFTETSEPCWEVLRMALKDRGLNCRFGRWDVPGNPKVILVDFAGHTNSNQLLYQLWERFGVDSMSGGWDYLEPVLFSHACGEIIAAAYNVLAVPKHDKAVAHFHEWMCGAGLLAVKMLAPEVGTVFTTHATMLGRALAGSGVDIYSRMTTISPVQEAAAYNITAKCSMESISAREADVFTTVSRITADEAKLFLGRTPDVITVNGLDMRTIHDFSLDREAAETNRHRLLEPVSRLLRHELPPNTRIMAISGRYEFRNKGVDAFLEALASAQQALQDSETHILALLLVMGGHSGVNAAAVSGDPNICPDLSMPGTGFLTSHHVYDASNDPILTACRNLGLNNREDNQVQVVFVPAQLNGNDGFLNMPYFEILSGCDLGVFPSWYEPWGYTPHESAAYGVPTVTTDLSGFGIWAREQEDTIGSHAGVVVLPRRQKSYEEVVESLRKTVLEYATCSTEKLDEQRRAVRSLVGRASWADFFNNYIEAYDQANTKARARGTKIADARKHQSVNLVLEAKSSTTPHLRTLTTVAELPPPLSRLRELAYNLWWCWHPKAVALFHDLNPQAWERFEHNPIRMIEEADSVVLAALANSPNYLERYEKVMAEFDAYMAGPLSLADMSDGLGVINPQRPVAYFSTEYGLHESLPLYSGGLGVLSGDHLKSASDEGIPLVAVGLLYRNGYFRQALDRSGRQVSMYPENDFSTMAITPVRDNANKQIEIGLDMAGHTVYARIWVCQIGRISLYLMDTSTPTNTEEDRGITSRLYESDREVRLRQEILLGMGGVRLLRTLGLVPSVYHMNEGHSAFLTLERIRQHIRDDELSITEAATLVKGKSVFTTHTPVDAGNERFSLELMERYFRPFAQSIGMDWQSFLRLGRQEGGDPRTFDMTVLALRFSSSANAVSALHGFVSRRMWRNIWKGFAEAEVPIGAVTNGIHTASYVGPEFRRLLDSTLGAGWLSLPPEAPEWHNVAYIPDDQYWEARRIQKEQMVEFFRARLQRSASHDMMDYERRKVWMSQLNSDALIIGFARRFAPYKRATMLFADPDRLARLLNQPGRPVVLLFSGKAHPADEQGIDLIQEVVRYSLDPRFFGKIFFLEDYSLEISRMLVQGCDVWLNTPRRPYEASGTSGEKVPVNGGINLSISDGWWVEGYNRKNGWTIGPVMGESDIVGDNSDYADAESLYCLLEDEVIPLFFEREGEALPHRWIAMSKNSLESLTAQYSSTRMVRDYVEQVYRPAAKEGAILAANHQKLAKRLGAWRQEIAPRFHSVQLEQIHVEGIDGDSLVCGQPLNVSIQLKRGNMGADELEAQFVIGPTDGQDFVLMPDIVKLEPQAPDAAQAPDVIIFKGQYIAARNGRFAYGVRVSPVTEGVNPLQSNLVLWG